MVSDQELISSAKRQINMMARRGLISGESKRKILEIIVNGVRSSK